MCVHVLFQAALSENDILHMLPSKQVTLDIMLVTKILSDRGTKSLGDFEVTYQFDPISQMALKRQANVGQAQFFFS